MSRSVFSHSGETVAKCCRIVANQVAFSLSDDEQECFVDGEMQVHCLKYYKYTARSPLVLSD